MRTAAAAAVAAEAAARARTNGASQAHANRRIASSVAVARRVARKRRRTARAALNGDGGGTETESNGVGTTSANGNGVYAHGNGASANGSPTISSANGYTNGNGNGNGAARPGSGAAQEAGLRQTTAGGWLKRTGRSISSSFAHDTEYLDSWDFWRRKWRQLRGKAAPQKGRRNSQASRARRELIGGQPKRRTSGGMVLINEDPDPRQPTQIAAAPSGGGIGGWLWRGGGRRGSTAYARGTAGGDSGEGGGYVERQGGGYGGGGGGGDDEDTYGFWSDFDSTSAPEYFREEPELYHSRPKDLLQVITAVVIGPLVVSTSARLIIIEPLLDRHARLQPASFPITSSQRLEVARRVEDWERGIRYEQLMGRAPKLGEKGLEEELREEAGKFETEARNRNIKAVGNVVTDVTLAAIISAGILVNRRQLVSFRQRLGRLFFGLGASQQAVFILLVADVLVGYHSSDGWVAFISLCLEHYGISPQGNEAFVSLFVATVPVLLDVTFKYWVFSKLRRLSPSTQVILDELERH